MGGHIANALEQIITREYLLEQAKSRVERPRAVPNDRKVLPEEGDQDAGPSGISRGYVVIRKKDLF